MQSVLGFCCAIGVLALAGCAAPPEASSQFDGTYSGGSVVTRGGNTYCGPNLPQTFAVTGGRFDYIYPIIGETTLTVPTQIAADGTISGRAQYFDTNYALYGGRYVWVTVLGHIAGGALDAQVESVSCARHLSLTRG